MAIQEKDCVFCDSKTNNIFSVFYNKQTKKPVIAYICKSCEEKHKKMLDKISKLKNEELRHRYFGGLILNKNVKF